MDTIKTYNCVVDANSHAVLTVALANGVELSFSTEQLPDNVKAELLAYGLKQKMIDSVAARSAKGWTEEDVSEKLESLFDSMKDGNFTTRQAGASLVQKVEDAKNHLSVFLEKTSEEKAMLSSLGVTESSLRKALNTLTTKLAKSLKESASPSK